MAVNDSDDLLETIRTNEELQDQIRHWEQENANRDIVVVIAGKSGTGKSTLINNFLTFDAGQERPVARRQPKSVTKKVEKYNGELNSVRIRAVDMPGLYARKDRDNVEREVVASLCHITDGKADILMYCVSLTQRLDLIDERNIDTLIKAFGKKVWDNAIFVLTHADSILDEHEADRANISLDDLVQEFIEELQTMLAERDIEMCVKPLCLYHSSESTCSVATGSQCNDSEATTSEGVQAQDVKLSEATTKIPVQISVIPTGMKSNQRLNWKELLLAQIIEICQNKAISKLTELRGVDWEKICNTVVKGTAVGTVGALAIGARDRSTSRSSKDVLSSPIGAVRSMLTAAGSGSAGAIMTLLMGSGGIALVAFLAGAIVRAHNNVFKDIAFYHGVLKKLDELQKKGLNESS